MTAICIDTQILYWAIIGRGKKVHPFIQEARDFTNWIIQQDMQVMIPAIVAGEIFVSVETQNIPKAMAQFQQDWLVVDYDLRAAMLFAKMRQDHAFKKRKMKLQGIEKIAAKN